MSSVQHIFIITSQYLNSFTVVFPSKVVAWWNKNLEDATLPIKQRLGWFVKDLHGSCPRPSMYRIFTHIYMNGWFFLGAMKLNIPIPWMRIFSHIISDSSARYLHSIGEDVGRNLGGAMESQVIMNRTSYSLLFPLIFMVQWKMGPEKIIGFLSFGAG